MQTNREEVVKLAHDLELPVADLTCKVSTFLGNRGGGKSNGAALAVEQVLAAGAQVVVLDYVGIWYGLRLGRDGKSPSRFEIPILGGRHGDIELSASAGKVVAEALASSRSAAILDLSLFSKSDRCSFATDFAEAFFVAKKQHRGPSLIVLEEAQRFVPQRLQRGQERMLGAWEEIAEVGRNFGIGLFLISQRPQKIAKDVLNLADHVFAFRTNGVLERKAIHEWVQEKGQGGGQRDIVDQLPGLPTGSCYAWAPERGTFGRHALRLKETYDTGATPATRQDDVVTSPLDLEVLEAAMGEAVVEAGRDKSAELRDEVARLRARVRELERSASMTAKTDEWVSGVAEASVQIDELVRQSVDELSQRLRHRGAEILAVMRENLLGRLVASGVSGKVESRREEAATIPAKLRRPSRGKVVGDSVPRISVGESRILTAAVQYDLQGGVTREMLTVLAGYKKSSRDTFLQRLKAAGLLEQSGDRYLATELGRELDRGRQPLPTGSRLLEYWRGQLSPGEWGALAVSVDSYPEGVDKEKILSLTGYRRSSVDTFLQRLRARGLIVVGGGTVTASDLLFDRVGRRKS